MESHYLTGFAFWQIEKLLENTLDIVFHFFEDGDARDIVVGGCSYV